MDWEKFSKIADIFSVLGFLASLVLFFMSHSIFKKLNCQKQDYTLVRKDMKASLMAARNNIFEDKIYDLHMRSDLRAKLFECRQRFSFILGPCGIWHLQRSIQILNKGIPNVDYLMPTY